MHKQVHPDLSKAEKRRLCQILECQRLSPEVRAHAVKNELLPLRTVVQLVYFEQEKGSNKATNNHKLQKPHELLQGVPKRPATRDTYDRQSLGRNKEELTRRTSHAENREKGHHKNKLSDGRLVLDMERKMVIRGGAKEIGSEKVRGAKEECMSECKLDLDSKKVIRKARSNKSEHGREKGRQRQ